MFLHVSVCPQGVCYPSMHCRCYPSMPCSRSWGGYPSMPCRFSGPHPRGKLRAIRSRPTAKWEVEGIQSRPTAKGEVEGDQPRGPPWSGGRSPWSQEVSLVLGVCVETPQQMATVVDSMHPCKTLVLIASFSNILCRCEFVSWETE